MNKIPIYFMPGLAASSKIFENLSLSDVEFELFFLEWEIPLKNESLKEYAERMSKKIIHENSILIGVSFGGILVQEMASFILTNKIIIISSVKNKSEFPNRIKFIKAIKAYKLIPTGLILKLETLGKLILNEKINKKIKLYEKYLSVRNVNYLDWAFEQVVLWERTVTDERVIHIHGDQDEVFPIKNIKKCIVVKGGTHVMILNKFKWFNENLPLLLKS